jgi:hypothetical protein
MTHAMAQSKVYLYDKRRINTTLSLSNSTPWTFFAFSTATLFAFKMENKKNRF